MLTFEETEDYYIMTETTMSFTKDYIKSIKYTKDLKLVQINDEPWLETYPAQVEWFEKYHMKHFKHD